MTLEQLRIFVAVGERQHLTGAAAALNLSPSAVSAALRTLEGRYGTQLFYRVGRGIELSEAGRSFLPQARGVLAAAADAARALTETAGLERGSLNVKASQTIAGYWVPEVLMAYHRAYPGISLSLDIGNTRTVADAILAGAADIGFIEGEIDEPALAQRIVAEDRLLIVCARHHPWADGHRLSLEEIAAAIWVLREEGSGTRSVFEAGLAHLGLAPKRLEVMMNLPSNEAIRTAVAGSNLVGVMSARVAVTAIEAGRLACANFPLLPRAFTMLWHKERYRSPAALALEAILAPPDEA